MSYSQRQLLAMQRPVYRDLTGQFSPDPHLRKVHAVRDPQAPKSPVLQMSSILAVDMESEPLWYAAISFLTLSDHDPIMMRNWREWMLEVAAGALSALVPERHPDYLQRVRVEKTPRVLEMRCPLTQRERVNLSVERLRVKDPVQLEWPSGEKPQWLKDALAGDRSGT